LHNSKATTCLLASPHEAWGVLLTNGFLSVVLCAVTSCKMGGKLFHIFHSLHQLLCEIDYSLSGTNESVTCISRLTACVSKNSTQSMPKPFCIQHSLDHSLMKTDSPDKPSLP